MYSIIAILLLSAACASIGQVAFKKGMIITGGLNIEYNIKWIITMVKIILSPYVFSGMVLYALSTILWLVALSRCTLNFAYPFTAVTFVLVILLSFIVLKEPLPVSRIIGMAVIIGGIFIVSMN